MADKFKPNTFVLSWLTRLIGLGIMASLFIAILGLFSGVEASLDAFSHFRPFMAAATAVLLLSVLIIPLSGKRTMLSAAIVGLFLHGHPVFAEAGLALPDLVSATSAENAKSMRFITFNMWGRNRKHDEIVDFVRREMPDILVLQEAFADQKPLVDRLQTILPHRVDCIGGHACNLAILSRAPIVDSKVYLRKWRGHDTWSVPIIVARIAGNEAASHGQETTTVVATHLSWPLPAHHQQKQFRQLSKVISEVDSGRIIVAGDFNSTPWSQAFNTFEKNLPLNRLTHFLATWPSKNVGKLYYGFSFLPIDHVFVSAPFALKTIRRGPPLGSDHRPVIVDLLDAG